MLLILEVADLDASARLYREAFGIPLEAGDNGGDDRWIGGAHAELSWREGSYFHFALSLSKDGTVTTGAQVALTVEDIAIAHTRAVAAGAEVVHEPRDEPWGPTSRYRDLHDNVIHFTQHAR